MPDAPSARQPSSEAEGTHTARGGAGDQPDKASGFTGEPIGGNDAENDSSWKPAQQKSIPPQWLPPWAGKILRFGFRTAMICIILIIGVGAFYFTASLSYDIGEIQKMPERSVIFDIDGKELATLHGENRRLISRMEIPDFFVSALEAREDKRFFTHSGVDIRGILRATMRNASDMSFTQGASTLTMQLARNSFNLREKSLHRKLVEIAIALRIEASYSKDEILSAYVNRIYFGSGCHGLEEASRRYFGVSATDLTRRQCALLVGIIRAPHACSPLRALEKATLQQDEVLARMVTEKSLSPEEASRIQSSDLGLSPPGGSTGGNRALQAVRRHFEELIDARDIRNGGLRLQSTISSNTQELLEGEAQALLEKIPGSPEIAVVCIDTRTGAIRGIVGGRATGNTSFNRALDARRDLGEIFTPFVYAAAAERGIEPRQGQPVTLGRELGTEDLIRLAERFGFRGPFLEGDDLFRGGVSATPLEVAAASAALTAEGQKPRTYFLRKLLDSDGNQILSIEPSSKSAFAPAAMRAALETHFPDNQPPFLLGTSLSKTDAWAVWLGSERTTCLWIGYDTPTRLDSPDILLSTLRDSIQRLGAAQPKLASASSAKK
tara:strand:+ start:2468 stop:4294 length:1827 start_codon:yes stop_codon:yes gene_type:complete